MKFQKLFVFIILMINLHTDAALSQQKDENLIQTTCKNTPNNNLCLSILHANKKSATADVEGLGLIMVGAVKDKSQEALSTANNLIKSGVQPRDALEHCATVYNAVLVGDVPMAEQALIRGQPKFAEDGMADAVVEADICDRGFAAKSPLSELNEAVRQRAAVAKAIIRNLL